jgi:phage-related protein
MADIYSGIIFENRHSYHDFGAFLSSATIGYPKEIKIKERVPYSNFVYDFSYLFGEKGYEERTLKFEFTMHNFGGIVLHYHVSEFVNWLQSGVGKQPLIYTKIPEYHFSAECSEISVEYPISSVAKISATFTADPFRIPNDENSGLSEVI